MGFQVFAKLVNITPISLGFTVDILILNLVGGFNHLETYEFVSWVSWDDYSQYMESHNPNVPNHQPVISG